LLIGALDGCGAPLTATSLTTTAPSGASEQIPVYAAKPDGPGPFPAVVIVQDCSGQGPASSGAPDRWSAQLVRRGYVVIVPDKHASIQTRLRDAALRRAGTGKHGRTAFSR